MPPKVGEFKASIYTRSTALIKARFKTLKELVDKLASETEPLTSVKIKGLQTYSAELKKKRQDFENNLQRVLALEGEDSVDDEILSKDQDDIQELFSHIQATIETLFPADTPSALDDTTTSVESSRQPPAHVRLPKLDLQRFSGDPLTWTSFINLFDTTIHRNASLSSVMKFQYLLSVLNGEPLNLVRSLTLTAQNYLVAYDLLRDRYHNARRLQSLHLNQLLDLPNITAHSLKGLRHFVNLFTEHSQALKALNCDVITNNPLLSALLLRKMDQDLRKKLEVFRSHSDEPSTHTLPEVNDIIKFLNTECSQTEDANVHNISQGPKPTHSPSQHKAMPKKAHFRSDVAMVTTQSSNARPSQAKFKPASAQCFVCNSNTHKIYSCDVFKNKTPQERYQLIKQYPRCISCLGSHDLKDCQSLSTCRTCDKRHHTMLHFPSQGNHANYSAPPHNNKTHSRVTELPANDKNSHTSVTLTSQGHQCSSTRHTTVLLGTLLVKLTSSQGTTHVFRALLDSGSMCDLITEHAAQLLGIRRFKSDIKLTGLSQHATKNKGQAYLNIETLSGQLVASQHPMLILDKLTVNLPRVPVSQEVFERTKRYCLADPSFHLPGRIDVVIGGALYPQLLTNKQFSLGRHMPHVVGTHFGYIVMGSAPCASPPATTSTFEHSSSHVVSLHAATDYDLHTSLQKFWQQEEPPSYSKKSEEESLCDQHFETTHYRDTDGRYVVRLPFKPGQQALGVSRPQAEQRFHSLERKLKSQPEFHTLYVQGMNEYIAQDHMVKVEDLDSTTPHYFLPHHGVLKEGSSTTKLRTVFDASSKTSNGFSLNDLLMTGPKLQTNICDILLHFRSHKVVFSCDIRQMYRQIKLHPEDQLFQLLLWRDDPSDDLSVYKLTRVTFGINSSPYLAIKTLSQLAIDEGASFAEAARVIKTQTYVDDVISGAETEDEALNLQNQLTSLLKRGGFELRKWCSNSERLLQALPKDQLETPVFLRSEQPHFSILGLNWSPVSDCFTFNMNVPRQSHTKRQVLSLIAQIYDPCGFLAPVTMWAKAFMQILWTKGLGWDDPLPSDLAEKWHTFVLHTKEIGSIKIPRYTQIYQADNLELHGFSDASETGYAAVIFFRSQPSQGDVSVRLIIAKTRVAPLKRVTLPRLELCGAYLLAQLVAYCLEVFSQSVTFSSVRLWCDSTVALTWIQTPPFKLKTYVANRVAQIQELIPPTCWNHISSAYNPADCASRGLLPSQLPDHTLWWNGPHWLRQPPDQWPVSPFRPIEEDRLDEIKTTPISLLVTAENEEWDLLTKFSSWTKLCSVMAYVLRFFHNMRHHDKLKGHISVSELKAAGSKIFKLVQHSSLSKDISALQRNKPVSSCLRRLTPLLDADGLLRVGGRLNASDLHYDSRHPIILPKKHHVVNILIDHYHIKHLHAGAQLTQSLLAQRVWILSARSVIRSRIFKCVTCFRNKPHNKTPLMGDLPPSRVTPARPFLSTGVDYCGPFMVKVMSLRSIKHVKTYLCVFVCMVTKAVHLEVVTDLTTEGFIAALTRFVSRRGLCAEIYSDCGTNFVGADAALRRLMDDSINSSKSKETIHRFSAQHGINFHFNPPASPHQGGLWESAVKSAKYHLRRVMGDTVLTLSQFMTLSTQVEAMLNSRPLTPLSSDPSDMAALTPGHFLTGAPLTAVPEPKFSDLPSNRLKHWQLVQAFHQRIWQRWSLEYIHMLQQRSKWNTPAENLKIGDLVLVHQTTPPLTWPLARIVGVHPGKDGIVRVVDLQTATGHLTRPAVKVFPLPMN